MPPLSSHKALIYSWCYNACAPDNAGRGAAYYSHISHVNNLSMSAGYFYTRSWPTAIFSWRGAKHKKPNFSASWCNNMFPMMIASHLSLSPDSLPSTGIGTGPHPAMRMVFSRRVTQSCSGKPLSHLAVWC